MAEKPLWIDVDEPRPGDLALHKVGHDGRIVTRVEGAMIWLYLMGKETGPFPGSSYTYKRWNDEGEQE